MQRVFLFLQGPHGPFFAGLARALEAAGAATHRVLFNRGDALFRARGLSSERFDGAPGDWPEFVRGRMAALGVTDLVVYGDTRPVHAAAVAGAAARGITVHVVEEGYLRPWWVTYERGGANGHSPLMGMSMDDIRAALAGPQGEPVEAPEGWGALYRHMAYGALYHAGLLTGGTGAASHRDVPVAREAALHVRRLATLPAQAVARRLATRALLARARPFHLVLLQLDHDASFRDHGPFPGTEAFLDRVMAGFARGAPAHHMLALKAHPLEDGRVPLPGVVARLAREHGIGERVVFIPGGRLGPLLDRTKSVVTVNSTAAQQALFRGIPVKCFGAAVYARPEFVSGQPLDAFFAAPAPPDAAAYGDFRRFLLETSQLPGSFYAAPGRRQLYRHLPDLMLAPGDRYRRAGAAGAQHLAAVPG